jgi:hypothetical protein
MKLYTFVVHYLQICMKEYGCCPKFKKIDNSTYTFTKMVVVYLVSATPPKPLIGLLWNFTHLWYTTCRCAWRNMVAVQNFKGEIIQHTFTKRGRVYLVSATPTKLLIEFCESSSLDEGDDLAPGLFLKNGAFALSWHFCILPVKSHGHLNHPLSREIT